MTPKRIQRKRTRGWRKPDNTVCVTRPGFWGNPYSLLDDSARDRDRLVAYYRDLLVGALEGAMLIATSEEGRDKIEHVRAQAARLSELRGKNLACYCALDKPCHADVLLELANR